MKQIILFNKKYVEDIDFGNGFKLTSDTLDNISNIDKTINEMFNYAGIKQSGDFLKDINNGQLLRDYKWTILNYDETKCDECLNDIMDFETSGFDSFEKTKMEKVLNNCLKLNFAKNSKYLQSLKRFNTACKRTDMGDQILDIAACLESLFNINNELRLRLALSAYYLTKDWC